MTPIFMQKFWLKLVRSNPTHFYQQISYLLGTELNSLDICHVLIVI